MPCAGPCTALRRRRRAAAEHGISDHKTDHGDSDISMRRVRTDHRSDVHNVFKVAILYSTS